jgi:hypothetical protein
LAAQQASASASIAVKPTFPFPLNPFEPIGLEVVA